MDHRVSTRYGETYCRQRYQEVPAMEQLMTPGEVADLIQKPVRTLAQWRWLRTGPRFVKCGGDVRYFRSDIVRWLDEQAVEPRPAA